MQWTGTDAERLTLMLSASSIISVSSVSTVSRAAMVAAASVAAAAASAVASVAAVAAASPRAASARKARAAIASSSVSRKSCGCGAGGGGGSSCGVGGGVPPAGLWRARTFLARSEAGALEADRRASTRRFAEPSVGPSGTKVAGARMVREGRRAWWCAVAMRSLVMLVLMVPSEVLFVCCSVRHLPTVSLVSPSTAHVADLHAHVADLRAHVAAAQ